MIEQLEQLYKKSSVIDKFFVSQKTYQWLGDAPDFEPDFPKAPLSLAQPPERKFLVKWQGLTYLDLTWETESDLAPFEDKLNQFKLINKIIEKKKRDRFNEQNDALRKYNELIQRPLNPNK